MYVVKRAKEHSVNDYAVLHKGENTLQSTSRNHECTFLEKLAK